jgi:UDP:flavonoid glycosyltransferase YjiC (YdhE family)
MRFSVVTCGSEGDTRPLAALCRGLLDRGHELKLFADDSTLTLPRMLGVPCEALQGDIKSILPGGGPQQELRISDIVRVVSAMKDFVGRNQAAWLRAVGEHAQRSDAILFCSLAFATGLILREELRKTAVFLAFTPAAPTREFCTPSMRPMRLPGWVNRWTHRMAYRQLWGLCARSAPGARREVLGTAMTRLAHGLPVLCAVSKELVPQPADWPPHHLICGHWRNPVSGWQPPADLVDFLKGEPPIYAGFGSASAFVRGKALKTLVKAVAGRRVVFSPGWSNIDRSMLPESFFIARDVPHEWLFGRVSIAIHHGGAGTTHTAASAGVPQVILPFGNDQHFWAQRVAARGAGPRFAGRSAAAIARMIAFAELESTRRQAKALGEAMAREDGVGRTASELEALVERGQRD